MIFIPTTFDILMFKPSPHLTCQSISKQVEEGVGSIQSLTTILELAPNYYQHTLLKSQKSHARLN